MVLTRIGMGEAATGTPAVTGVQQMETGMARFLGGAKVWLSPSTIGAEFSALAAAAKLDMVGTLTSPRTLGFLLVPAAAIAVVWGMAAAKGRRQRNPRARLRRRNPRRRRVNPRRKSGAGHNYEVVVGNVGTVYRGRQGFEAHLTFNKYVGISKHGGGRTEGEPVTLFMDDEIIKEYAGTAENPKRKRRRNVNAAELSRGGVERYGSHVTLTREHGAYLVKRHPGHPAGHLIEGRATLSAARALARKMRDAGTGRRRNAGPRPGTYCQMCGAKAGRPHHDPMGKGRIVALHKMKRGGRTTTVCTLCRDGMRRLRNSVE